MRDVSANPVGMGPLTAGLAIFAAGLLPLAAMHGGPEKLFAAPAALATLQILVLLTVYQHCPHSIEAWQSANGQDRV